jgi:chaperonin GroES
MGLRPLGDRVLVEREKPKDKTPGGLHLPDAAQEVPQRGKVIKLPAEIKNWRNPGLEVGQTVVFSQFSGVEVDGLLLVKEEDLLAVVE